MSYLIAIVIGIVAASAGGSPPFILGILGAILWVNVIRLQARIQSLEEKNRALAETVQTLAPLPTPPMPPTAAEPSTPAVTEPALSPNPVPTLAPELAVPQPQISEPSPAPLLTAEPSAPSVPLIPVANFFQTNAIAKIGVLLVFVGVGFLVKYVGDRGLFPIELRLSALALVAIAMVVAGWKLREKHDRYGLTLQGAGVGVLYLTIFGAYRLYHLLPGSLTLILLVATITAASALAVIQDALALAVLSSLGGFLAPILASTGGGNHVALFSYYALLNFGILGIAYYKSWRALNFVGFFSTFLISGIWAAKYYQPLFFPSVQPFLILFFLTYSTIATLFAIRERERGERGVDMTLLFGVPLLTFMLQYGLVEANSTHVALSAAGYGAYYAALAFWLNQTYPQSLRFYQTACRFLALFFATVAVPFAVSGLAITTIWALEGVAVLWSGVVQKRFLQRSAGAIVTILSGIAFLCSTQRNDDLPALLNPFFSGVVILAVSFILSAYLLTSRSNLGDERDLSLANGMFFLGLCTWILGGLIELSYDYMIWNRSIFEGALGLATSDRGIQRVVSNTNSFGHYVTIFLALTAAIFHGLPERPALALQRMVRAALAPALALVLVLQLVAVGHALSGIGMLTWPLSIAVCYSLLRSEEKRRPDATTVYEHLVAFWSVTLILALEVYQRSYDLYDATPLWYRLSVVMVLTAIVLTTLTFRHSWPVARYATQYHGIAVPPLLVWCYGSLLLLNLNDSGAAPPLPYIPLLNPLDLSVLFFTVVLFRWRRIGDTETKTPSWAHLGKAVAGLGFIWLTGLLVRSLHHYLAIPWSFTALLNSNIVQTSLSIYWSITALGLMRLAIRRHQRPLWLCGAGLLGIVVVKLFLVDLADSGTLSRIISFLGTGALLLYIGYVAPIPPDKKESPAHKKE